MVKNKIDTTFYNNKDDNDCSDERPSKITKLANVDSVCNNDEKDEGEKEF